MAINTIADLNVTPTSNSDLLGQRTSGTEPVNKLDDMVRNLSAIIARGYADAGGTGTVGGSANAITVTSNSTYQTLKDGMLIAFKAKSANTGAATLNLDSLGVKAIRRPGDTALSANDIVVGGIYQLRYDAAYNSAAGAWVLLNAAADSQAKGPDIASAATLTIGAGSYFHVTGTTTITSIVFATPKDGRRAALVFDGALTLTHNATTMPLPGGANITTEAGDILEVWQDATGNVKCVFHRISRGIVSQAEAEAGTAAIVRDWTAERVKQAVTALAQGIGSGQTWQNVSGSRSDGTSYRNTTGKPIQVAVHYRASSTGSGTGQGLQVSSDNSTWIDIVVVSARTTDGAYAGSAVVPNNWYYRWSGTSNFNRVSWAELR